MTSTGFGSSAAPVSDGSERGERPGNTWLFTPGIQKTGNAR